MNNFVKAIIAILAIFGAVVAALVIIDKINNKNRIKGDYLECETEDFAEEDEE